MVAAHEKDEVVKYLLLAVTQLSYLVYICDQITADAVSLSHSLQGFSRILSIIWFS